MGPVTEAPMSWKWIRAPTLERRSLPSKGYGQSRTCRKEWVTLPEARCTFRSVVHRHNFPPVDPCTQAALVLMGPLVLVSTVLSPCVYQKGHGLPPYFQGYPGLRGRLLALTVLIFI